MGVGASCATVPSGPDVVYIMQTKGCSGGGQCQSLGQAPVIQLPPEQPMDMRLQQVLSLPEYEEGLRNVNQILRQHLFFLSGRWIGIMILLVLLPHFTFRLGDSENTGGGENDGAAKVILGMWPIFFAVFIYWRHEQSKTRVAQQIKEELSRIWKVPTAIQEVGWHPGNKHVQARIWVRVPLSGGHMVMVLEPGAALGNGMNQGMNQVSSQQQVYTPGQHQPVYAPGQQYLVPSAQYVQPLALAPVGSTQATTTGGRAPTIIAQPPGSTSSTGYTTTVITQPGGGGSDMLRTNGDEYHTNEDEYKTREGEYSKVD
ncbi:unnamed protein product [Amoebophrya sp. A25]|nr:unnamed protein product [Amoebophrya sp. A25]|eukprot:GSA25T00027047001.1